MENEPARLCKEDDLVCEFALVEKGGAPLGPSPTRKPAIVENGQSESTAWWQVRNRGKGLEPPRGFRPGLDTRYRGKGLCSPELCEGVNT